MKIVASSLQAAGHMNAVIGLCQALCERDHQIYFVIESGYSGKLKQYGFEEIVLESKSKSSDQTDQTQNPVKYYAEKIRAMGVLSNLSPREKFESMVKRGNVFQDINEKDIEEEIQIKRVIEEIQPDLILIDNLTIPPCILRGKTPWIFIWSAHPLLVYNSRKLPPFGLGLPTNSDTSAWNEFYEILDEWKLKALAKQNKLLAHFGYPPIEWETMARQSPFLNIYGYPKELDYHDIVPRPDKVLQVDGFNRFIPEPYQMPEELKINPSDKVVYISMGSLGSIDIDLMKRITEALKDTPHKYIVSKGPLSEEYDLPDNMWGEGYLPQTSILPLVDLVIIHGGNNSTAEAICAGKPMIVMPLFADQFDNAQRVQEKGLGVRIEPYQFEPNQLIEAVNRLLMDKAICLKAEQVAKRIAQDNSKQQACLAIEELAFKH